MNNKNELIKQYDETENFPLLLFVGFVFVFLVELQIIILIVLEKNETIDVFICDINSPDAAAGNIKEMVN